MPSSRAVLIDITTSGADPSKPHAVIGAAGRLRFAEPKQGVIPGASDEIAHVSVVEPEPEPETTSHVPPMPVKPVVVPVLKKERGFPRRKKDVVEQSQVEPQSPPADVQPQLA